MIESRLSRLLGDWWAQTGVRNELYTWELLQINTASGRFYGEAAAEGYFLWDAA